MEEIKKLDEKIEKFDKKIQVKVDELFEKEVLTVEEAKFLHDIKLDIENQKNDIESKGRMDKLSQMMNIYK